MCEWIQKDAHGREYEPDAVLFARTVASLLYVCADVRTYIGIYTFLC